MLLINSFSEIGSLLPEDLLAKTLFTFISLTLQSEEVIWKSIMFPNIRGSGTWWKFSQSVISCGKTGMVNVHWGVHSYPNADGAKPFQTRGRIWGSTMKIIGITEITAICTCCPRSQFPSPSVSGQGSGTFSTAEWWPLGKWDLLHYWHLYKSWQPGYWAKIPYYCSASHFWLGKMLCFWLASNGNSHALGDCSGCSI